MPARVNWLLYRMLFLPELLAARRSDGSVVLLLPIGQIADQTLTRLGIALRSESLGS
jgi:hypothetical protein